MLVQNPLEGCIVAGSCGPWQGLKKIQQLATDAQYTVLPTVPGFFTIEKPSKPEQEGWFVPVSLVEMGRRPALLKDYPPEEHTRTPSGLELDDHQLRATTFLRRVTDDWAGAILGADPGTGKTMAALQALWLDGFLHKKGIVVAPNQARSTWVGKRSDPAKHYELNIIPLEGQTPCTDIFTLGNWFFIHYEILQNWHSWIFNQLRPETIVFDESHTMANPRTLRSNSGRQLSKAKFIKRRYCLTGTPIPKYRMDLWAQLAASQPNQWGENPHQYGLRHCNGRRETTHEGGEAHWVYDGETNTDELRARLSGVYLRFTKEEVKDKIPELERRVITLERDDIDLETYWEAQMHVGKYSKEKEAQEYIEVAGKKLLVPKTDDKKSAKHLTSLTALICELEMAKLPEVIKEVCRLTGEYDKLLVFCHQRKAAKKLVTALRKLATPAYPGNLILGPIDGHMPQTKRAEEARKFEKLVKGTAVCTRASMGTALNELGTANAGIQVCPDWNPSNNIQCESRWQRKNNPNKKVEAIYFRVPNTVDDLFLRKLDAKAKASAAVSPVDSEGMSLVSDLMPQGTAGSGDDLDEICAILAEMEEE